MSFQQFLLILRARYGIILVTFAATVAIAFAVSVLLPPRYTAEASVVVDARYPDPIAGMSIPPVAIPGYIATQADIIASDNVAQKVVKLLKLVDDPTMKEQWLTATEGKKRMEVWLRDKLLEELNVKAKAARESHILGIQYTALDSAFAAAAANAFARAYIETRIEMRAEPARQYASWFEGQGKMLRESLERAQKRLSAYHQKHGIVASEERFDIETGKLNDLSAQLTAVIGQTTEAHSKQRSGEAAHTLPEIVQNPLIQNLKAEIARREAALQELAGDLGVNHPQYQNLESIVASLKKKLEAETLNITSGFSTSRSVSKNRENELRAAIEAQKRKVLEIKRARDELDVLRRDVDASQKAYDMVSERMHQTTLESKVTQSDVAILTTALEPTEPSFPKLKLNMWIAIFLGPLLGVGGAFVAEILDRRVRSTDDLTWLVQLPVLGAIDRVKLRGRRIALPRAPLTTQTR